MRRGASDGVYLWTAFFVGWWTLAAVGALTGWLWVAWHPLALGFGGLAAAGLLHCVVPLTDPEDPAHKD